MSLSSFTDDRPAVAAEGNKLASWHLASTAGATVEFCNGSAVAPVFQVILPATSSASQAYPKPLYFRLGVHVEVVSGAITLGAIDLI